jgi:AcrR family transcriptional regulator
MVAAAKRAKPVRSRRPAARRRRVETGAARREAILAAALDEFSARGFAAARLDDVARRAGVAKGTIYLYFRDKEALFQELVRSVIGPLVARFETTVEIDLPARVIAERVVELFVREVYGTRRKDVIRLIITEGPRFPKLAEFYYREVISRVIAAVRALLRRAAERGEIAADVLMRFPQLLVAPGLVAIIWSGLFDRFAPLDVEALMRSHLDLLFGERRAP